MKLTYFGNCNRKLFPLYDSSPISPMQRPTRRKIRTLVTFPARDKSSLLLVYIWRCLSHLFTDSLDVFLLHFTRFYYCSISMRELYIF